MCVLSYVKEVISLAKISQPYVRFMMELHPEIKRGLMRLAEARSTSMKQIAVEALNEYLTRHADELDEVKH